MTEKERRKRMKGMPKRGVLKWALKPGNMYPEAALFEDDHGPVSVLLRSE